MKNSILLQNLNSEQLTELTKNSILLQNLNSEQLKELIGNVFDTKLKDLQNLKPTEPEEEKLLTRKEVLKLLKINASTLWHWQNKGRITAYKFANKCYYKRSELMASITPLNK